jgi:hypothetical protein
MNGNSNAIQEKARCNERAFVLCLKTCEMQTSDPAGFRCAA